MNETKPASVVSRLRLDGHCIACAVNRRAHELIEGLLNCEDEAVIQDLNRELERLTRFHQRTDFNRLRAEKPELAGSRCVDVTLREDATGRFDISVQPAERDEQERKDVS